MEKGKLQLHKMMSDEDAAACELATLQSTDEGRQALEMRRRWRERQPGEMMPDGTIYLGLHQAKDWFVQPEDIKGNEGGRPLVLSCEAPVDVAQNLVANGYDDWMLPPGNKSLAEPDILSEIFKNR